MAITSPNDGSNILLPYRFVGPMEQEWQISRLSLLDSDNETVTILHRPCDHRCLDRDRYLDRP
jgi:hypothetical protein